MGNLFGTDGVRGVAGEFLTSELALGLARAATTLTNSDRPRVLILRDPRASGEMLEAAIAAGVAEAGGDAWLGGVLPTPAIPILIKKLGFDLGVMISASHNPYRDNGIKFFTADGYKLSDEMEQRIEERLANAPEVTAEIGRVHSLRGADSDYLRALTERFESLDLSGMKIALDCANGATFKVGPEIFQKLGAEVVSVAVDPDGRNINAECGSTHPEVVAQIVQDESCDIGFAFDGDGDRMLAIDESGELVDGDELIALAAVYLKKSGSLNGGVAVTVMTNYGFGQAMEAAGIEVQTTDVGDRYVLAELRERGWKLGGEQSGHIIQMDFVPSGDGIASALLTLEALGDRKLSQRDGMKKIPQKLVNVRVADRAIADKSSDVQSAIAAASERLEGRGRVLVRPSGTEPLVRVMVEAPTTQETDQICESLVAVIEEASRIAA